MNTFLVPILISGILCLLLSIITWLLRGQEPVNRMFALFSFILAVDSFAYFFWYQFGDIHTMQLWMKTTFFLGFFVPIGMISFFFTITGFDRNNHFKIWGIRVLYFRIFSTLLFVACMVLSVFTDLVTVIPENPAGPWDIQSGPFIKFVIPFFAVIFLYMLTMVVKSFRMSNTNRARRRFITLIAIGTLSWVVIGYAAMIVMEPSGPAYEAANYIGVIVMVITYFLSVVNYQVDMMKQLNTDLEEKVHQLENEIIERERIEKLAREQQEKLLQADKMASVGILVSGVAHEINNPNNYMQLNSNNLSDVWKELCPFLESYAGDHHDFAILGMPFDEIREEISLMIKALNEGPERIRKIVQTLKDFARKDPGDIDQTVDVNAVIDASTTILSNMIKKSTNNFTYTPGDNLPPIKGNFQQLEQVVINLLSNSCQALTDRNKAISITSHFDPPSDSVRITVKDEGCGISKDDLKFIMDPFFTTKREQGGTGLGLSISYKIIQDFRGELLFSSVAANGTEAKIILPACRD